MNFLRRFFDTVKDMPSTNVRVFVSIGLSILYVLGSMLGFLLIGVTAAFRTVPINILPPQDVHEWTGIFLLIMMGVDVVQYGIKRKTHNQPASGETVVETETTITERSKEVSAPAGEAGV